MLCGSSGRREGRSLRSPAISMLSGRSHRELLSGRAGTASQPSMRAPRRSSMLWTPCPTTVTSIPATRSTQPVQQLARASSGSAIPVPSQCRPMTSRRLATLSRAGVGRGFARGGPRPCPNWPTRRPRPVLRAAASPPRPPSAAGREPAGREPAGPAGSSPWRARPGGRGRRPPPHSLVERRHREAAEDDGRHEQECGGQQQPVGESHPGAARRQPVRVEGHRGLDSGSSRSRFGHPRQQSPVGGARLVLTPVGLAGQCSALRGRPVGRGH